MEYDNNSDCYGADIIGSDDENLWTGTANAWSVLGDPDTSGYDPETGARGFADGPDLPPATPTYVEVVGRSGELDYQGFFLASNEETVRQFVAGIGVTDIQILEVTVLKHPVKAIPYDFFHVDDEESARLRGTLYQHKPISEQDITQ